MITAKNLSVQYIKEYATIFDVNFSIKSNTLFVSNHDEITALFRAITKIEKHYSGTILLGENDIKDIDNKDLSIAYVPKDPYLFKSKNVKANLKYPLKIRKYKKDDLNKKIDYLFNKYLYDFPLKLSKLNKSQRKIIALIRACTWSPKYIIIEHFFDDLDINYIELATKIIEEISTNSIIIASENKPISLYTDYEIIKIENGSIKKELD